MAASNAKFRFDFLLVSTHSHPKVAALVFHAVSLLQAVSTHSHPKVAAFKRYALEAFGDVSTHSHPKVAALRSYLAKFIA